MKPSLPQGTRDFKSDVLRKRNYIVNTIRKYFELYGFEPLETPALENIETLLGKYGDEGDKLIFKILNNGLDNENKRDATIEAFDNILKGKNDKNITSRALRYDLTIPFARFVALHFNELPMPFKRYQIQPVWRADRPQKGRYREFYQCDADVAGTYSLTADAEFALLYKDVFKELNIPVEIKLNNRKLLTGLAEVTGKPELVKKITIAIDKLDKIGLDEVKKELERAGLDDISIQKVEEYLSIKGGTRDRLSDLRNILQRSETALKGIEELEDIFTLVGYEDIFQLDTNLARGLDYYTGTIYEIKATNVKMGSIGGGGRYDDLTSLFGVKGVPGVGISFGIDRIYDVMEESELFPNALEKSSSVLFFNMGKTESEFAFDLLKNLRSENIACELYYEHVKLDRQFRYAEKRNISYVVIIGSREIGENKCRIKDLKSGIEDNIPTKELAHYFKEKKMF